MTFFLASDLACKTPSWFHPRQSRTSQTRALLDAMIDRDVRLASLRPSIKSEDVSPFEPDRVALKAHSVPCDL